MEEKPCDGSRSSIKKAASAKRPRRSTCRPRWPAAASASASSTSTRRPTPPRTSASSPTADRRPCTNVLTDNPAAGRGAPPGRRQPLGRRLRHQPGRRRGGAGRRRRPGSHPARSTAAEDPEPFDFVLMDCAPSLGVLDAQRAVRACNEVFIPLQPHFLALHGLGKLLETTALVGAAHQPGAAGHRHRAVHVRSEHEAGAGSGPRPAELSWTRAGSSTLPWNKADGLPHAHSPQHQAGGMPSFGQSIFAYAPTCNGAEDYAALADGSARQRRFGGHDPRRHRRPWALRGRRRTSDTARGLRTSRGCCGIRRCREPSGTEPPQAASVRFGSPDPL